MPTWSWASVPGTVIFNKQDALGNRGTGKILGVNVKYLGDQLLGQVEEAALYMSAPLIPGKAYHGSRLERLLLEGKEYFNRGFKRRHALRVGRQLVTFVPDYKFDTPGSQFIPEESSVVCLVLGRHRLYTACGLVVRCVSEKSHLPAYERIGYFEA